MNLTLPPKITDRAFSRLIEIGAGKQSKALRIAVEGGGCSGFQYEFTFDKKLASDDLKHENILIDKTSADLLKGSEVDFVTELIGDQFKISNPQSKSSCGCGVSFSV